MKAAARPNAHAHILAIAAYCLSLASRGEEARAYLSRIHETLPHYRVDDFLAAFLNSMPRAMRCFAGQESVSRPGADRLHRRSRSLTARRHCHGSCPAGAESILTESDFALGRLEGSHLARANPNLMKSGFTLFLFIRVTFSDDEPVSTLGSSPRACFA